jgi:hypothetical protein
VTPADWESGRADWLFFWLLRVMQQDVDSSWHQEALLFRSSNQFLKRVRNSPTRVTSSPSPYPTPLAVVGHFFYQLLSLVCVKRLSVLLWKSQKLGKLRVCVHVPPQTWLCGFSTSSPVSFPQVSSC